MTKLSDTQAILLSAAAQRESGSLYPLSTTLKASGGTAKAIDALIHRGLAEERETSEPDAADQARQAHRLGMGGGRGDRTRGSLGAS